MAKFLLTLLNKFTLVYLPNAANAKLFAIKRNFVFSTKGKS